MIRALGASPTPISWTETYTALQQKVVDGEENSISSIKFGKLNEVQKYLTLDGHSFGVDFVLINEKFYQSLPKDLQKTIRIAAAMTVTIMRGIQTIDPHWGSRYYARGVWRCTRFPIARKLFSVQQRSHLYLSILKSKSERRGSINCKRRSKRPKPRWTSRGAPDRSDVGPDEHRNTVPHANTVKIVCRIISMRVAAAGHGDADPRAFSQLMRRRWGWPVSHRSKQSRPRSWHDVPSFKRW